MKKRRKRRRTRIDLYEKWQQLRGSATQKDCSAILAVAINLMSVWVLIKCQAKNQTEETGHQKDNLQHQK